MRHTPEKPGCGYHSVGGGRSCPYQGTGLFVIRLINMLQTYLTSPIEKNKRWKERTPVSELDIECVVHAVASDVLKRTGDGVGET